MGVVADTIDGRRPAGSNSALCEPNAYDVYLYTYITILIQRTGTRAAVAEHHPKGLLLVGSHLCFFSNVQDKCYVPKRGVCVV